MNKLLIAGMAAGLCLTVNANAEKNHEHHREHDAHTHGVTQLNIAFEDKQLLIEMESPAANIVGFEHKPESEKDKAAFKSAMAQLKKSSQLFKMDSGAACKSAGHEIETSMDIDDHDHEKHKHHDDKQDERAHSDFEAQYEFACANPSRLKDIDVRLFKVFPKTHKINVQYIGDGGQKAATLDDHHSVFHLPKR